MNQNAPTFIREGGRIQGYTQNDFYLCHENEYWTIKGDGNRLNGHANVYLRLKSKGEESYPML